MGSRAITFFQVRCDVCGHTVDSPNDEPDGWAWLCLDALKDDAQLLCSDCVAAVREALRVRGNA